jgi:hypothetical protein
MRTMSSRRDARHILASLAELPTCLGSRSDDPRLASAHRPSDAAGPSADDDPERIHAIALNYPLTLGSSLFTRRGLAALQDLPLPRHTAQRRGESLELLTWLDTHIDGLDAQIATAASGDAVACRSMTHPGVGPLTALATILSGLDDRKSDSDDSLRQLEERGPRAGRRHPVEVARPRPYRRSRRGSVIHPHIQ